MAGSANELPRFERPPVIETVLGVQFEPLAGLCSARLGAFWKTLEADWPNVVDAPPLAPQFEQFGEAVVWGPGGFKLELSESPITRLQIRNAERDRMIQIQNGRLHYNWIGHGGESYPTYKGIKPDFDAVLRGLGDFLDKDSLGEIQPNQWEVTYLNHVPKGSVWNNPKDWSNLVRCTMPSAAAPGGARLESFGGEWHYEIEPQRGRLHVLLKHGRRIASDESEILVLQLTARGPLLPANGGIQGITAALDLGHETIVRAFKDITSEAAHTYWGLIDDRD